MVCLPSPHFAAKERGRPVLGAVLALLLGALALPLPAQPATELFFSEYIEGSSNNKALEIFNGTGAPINLGAGGYNVQMHFNGNPVAGLTINLMGTVAANDVFVLAQSAADPAILAVADQTNGAGWFNGDDAVVLRRGTVVVDVIGQIGIDPGTEWGVGNASTADNTLRRKPSVFQGDPVGNNAFDPSIEWDGFATNSFGALGCHPAATCEDVETRGIYEIQGNGLASPFTGQVVRTEDSIVTAVGPDGFFIQTPDAEADADPETSNGIFVFTGSMAPAVQVGDQVDVQGTVTEFFNLTEITGPTVTVDSTGNPLPAVIILDPTRPSPNQPQPATEMERFEGMIVRVENGLATGPTDRFGDTPIVAKLERLFREPGILYPGLPGLPVWDGNPEVFDLNANRLGLPELQIPAGAIIEVAEGPLAFDFGDYQIWPTVLSVNGEAVEIPVRGRQAGELTVASQNVLRLFDRVDDPDTDDPVPSEAVYTVQLAKLAKLIREGLGAPDVLAVQEVENLQALQDLAAKIQALDPSLVYTAYLLEGNDIGGIDVGFLVRDTVRVDSVTQFGKDDTFEFNGTTFILNDRPPLVLQGAYTGNGAPFPITVIAVHQRSLSGIEGSDGARVRAKRFEQAFRLSQYIQSLQTANPGLRLVVTGDFNAFEFSDGYVDVMGQVTGNLDPAGALLPGTDEVDPDLTNQLFLEPAEERYSFIFDGSAQALDHSLTSQALNPFVRGLDHVRGNADAPAGFSTNSTTYLRSADHDGLVLYLMSDEDADGFADDVDLCLGTAIPEATVPANGLGTNRWALVDGDLTFDTTPPAGDGPGLTFTIQDTGGCSCEQIIVKLGLGAGHQKFGCSSEAMQTWVGMVGQ
jgi:predicted extracellular nuclease